MEASVERELSELVIEAKEHSEQLDEG